MVDFRRARWGLRRTFQTEQAIEQLSVFDNVAMIHEHSKVGRATRRADVLAAIDYVGLDVAERQGRRPRTRATGGSSSSPGLSWDGPGSCCSTSLPRACRTRRPST